MALLILCLLQPLLLWTGCVHACMAHSDQAPGCQPLLRLQVLAWDTQPGQIQRLKLCIFHLQASCILL